MEPEQFESLVAYVEEENDVIVEIKTSIDEDTGHTFIDVIEEGRETRTVIRKDDIEGDEEEAVAVAFVTWVEEILDTPSPLAIE